MKKYLCFTDECLADYEKVAAQIDKGIDKGIEQIIDSFKVKLDKEQLIKQSLVLNGILIKYSEYLSNPVKFKEYEKEMVEYSQNHLVPYINNEVLIEYLYKSLYYFRNAEFCDDLCGLKDKIAKAIRKENIYEKGK